MLRWWYDREGRCLGLGTHPPAGAMGWTHKQPADPWRDRWDGERWRRPHEAARPGRMARMMERLRRLWR